MDLLSQLFYLHGIGYEYTKYTGEQVFFDQGTRSAALRCCGVDTENPLQIEHLNISLDAAKWLEYVPSCSLVQSDTLALKVRVDQRLLNHSCYISFDSLDIEPIEVSLQTLVQTGDYTFNDILYIELQVRLPNLPVGYHSAKVSINNKTASTEIWVTPKQSFQIPNKKRTGLSIQLYSLKNKAGLGIGDFADLMELTCHSAALQLDYILLNPLHLLFADDPERASPYSPNNRALLNPLYIAVSLCEDEHENLELKKLLQKQETHRDDNQYIDYTRVTLYKYQLLRCLYNKFIADGSCERKSQFSHFCHEHRTTLATLKQQDVEFASYLQWQAHTQLKQCQLVARDSGMAIGLINDLAVGCAGDGGEFINQQHLFAENAHVGAPPDPWAEQGQNWGLPALNPIKMGENNFAFYRALIKANMEDVGGLRIDHVMAIRRLWWCFNNHSQQDGCYVYYPFEYLLAILTIESHLNECIVIGEDLGVVPHEVKTALMDKAIFSNSLFYFEKNQHGEFLTADAFNSHCLLMIANHDVPPFFAWWEASDLSLKVQYKLINDTQYAQSIESRQVEKQRMLRFLELSGYQGYSLNTQAQEIYTALTLSLAHSPAQLFAIQLDDLDKQTLPVNIPGTDREYPNWRRVLSKPCAEILKEHANLLSEINSIRTY
jgi:4-alpha-glucanotransferase